MLTDAVLFLRIIPLMEQLGLRRRLLAVLRLIYRSSTLLDLRIITESENSRLARAERRARVARRIKPVSLPTRSCSRWPGNMIYMEKKPLWAMIMNFLALLLAPIYRIKVALNRKLFSSRRPSARTSLICSPGRKKTKTDDVRTL